MEFFDLTDNSDNVTLFPGQVLGKQVRGLDGNDTIVGSLDAEDINGNHGNDRIRGGAGNDFLRGGQENDTIYGDDGNDTVNGNFDNDVVYGGTGDDIVLGGKGNDVLFGEDGNDFISGDFGTDTLVGGNGNDVFVLRTDTAVSNPLLADVITDFNGIFDRIGLTNGTTEASISLVAGGGSLGFTAADTLIRLGTSGDFLGVVLGRTPNQVVGKFTSAPDSMFPS